MKVCFTVFAILLISCGDSKQKGIQSLEEVEKYLGKIERKIILNGRVYGDVILKDNYLYYLSINDSSKNREKSFNRFNLLKEELPLKIILPEKEFPHGSLMFLMKIKHFLSFLQEVKYILWIFLTANLL